MTYIPVHGLVWSRFGCSCGSVLQGIAHLHRKTTCSSWHRLIIGDTLNKSQAIALPAPATACASEFNEEAAISKLGPDDVSEL